MFFQKFRKFTVGVMLAFFIFSSLAQFILSAQPAQAIPVEKTIDIPQQIVLIKDMIVKGWKIAVFNAAQQSVYYFFRKMAYDSAVWLASGGKGQNPLSHQTSWQSYLADTAGEAAGTAIEELGEPFGLDLCKIPDIKVDLALRIGLQYNFAVSNEPRKPACTFDEFKKNWDGDAWASKYGDGKGGFDPGKVFNASLNVDQSPLGIVLNSRQKVDRLVMKQVTAASSDRAEGDGWKAVTNLIDGKIKAPAKLQYEKAKENTPEAQQKKDQAQISAAMSSGVYELIPSTLSLFLNTLSGQMLKNFKENGTLPFGQCVGKYGGPECKQKAASLAQNYDSTGSFLGRAAAEAVFSDFLTTKLKFADDYDIISQLNSCPGETHGLYECRADRGLVQALEEAKRGEPVTIREAMEKDWLRADFKLISPKRVVDDTNYKCHEDNYCYSNIKVLRQLRIVPLGFEIAAKNSNPDQAWTLKQVVDGFYDCDYQKDSSGKVININYDPINKPFCHLIDPNWVIKLPEARCDALGYGPVPMSGVPDRIQECQDLKTCVGYNKNGNCINFGYCAREKNVWKFEADECDAQFATCRAFKDSSGNNVAYLARTLDTGNCDQSTEGCRGYSLEQDNTGKWKAVSSTNYGSYNTGIYLNKNVSNSCSGNSAGCTAFQLSYSTSTDYNRPQIQGSNTTYLRKAPDYLNCYDASSTISGIQWPKSFSDLNKVQPRAECSDYAQVCIADEVGCSEFKPVGDASASAVPGKFTPATIIGDDIKNWNDQCDSKCVGYNTFQEMPTNYSGGSAAVYITPPSKYAPNAGLTCNEIDNGCSSFTNMSEANNGGEKIEYYTNLRACIKPDATKQKKYYTYEGSGVGGSGYQLVVYNLQKDPITGDPAYTFASTSLEQEDADDVCNETLYKIGLADTDCRQFNDDKGKVSYKLLGKTIVVSEQCTTYRLNSGEFPGAEQCFGNGVYDKGSCYYEGLPADVVLNAGKSDECSSPAALSCREYRGSHSNNIKTIFADTFENNFNFVEKGWSVNGGQIAVSNESTQPNGHSLEYSGQGQLIKSLDLQKDSLDISNDDVSFSLSFWVKGSNANLNISVSNSDGTNIAIVSTTANNSWQYFKTNITQETSFMKKGRIILSIANGNVYLDNFRLTKVVDRLFLVKNSLKVDENCDTNQNDNLPGEALGCTAYTGPKNNLGTFEYFLTNFSFLCRDGAIGCTALLDTFNTLDTFGPRAYNVYLPGNGGTKVTAQIGSERPFCQIPAGKTGCYVNVKNYDRDEIVAGTINGVATAHPVFTGSTYFIPGDTSSTDPIYLVASQAGSCQKPDLGCTYAGIQQYTPAGLKFTTTTIKLDPTHFEAFSDDKNSQLPGILCKQEADGCMNYGGSYFKDPQLAGAKVCTHREGVLKDDVKTKGWFWKDVGICGSTSTPAVLDPSNTKCSSDSDCTASTTYNTCIIDDEDPEPCYPNYLQNGNEYGLWSYGNTSTYENFVGECPAKQDSCSQFIDRNDNDKAYYFLKNNKLTQGNCDGQVSQKAGCSLFDQTDNPNKYWNTLASYKLSDDFTPDKNTDSAKVTKVKPVSNGSNDANIILSVKRDRECAEWLQCSQSHKVWDDASSRWKQVCEEVGRCNKLPESTEEDPNQTNCGNFIDGQHELSDEILTEEFYFNREITWKGNELTGYSILDMYPIEELGQFNFSTDTKREEWHLAKAVSCGSTNCKENGLAEYSCEVNDSPCGTTEKPGICKNGVCLQDPKGKKEDVAKTAPSHLCRAYPEKDSPFPNIASTYSDQNYSGVNRCNLNTNINISGAFQKGYIGQVGKDKIPSGSDALACECDYQKVYFGNGSATKFVGYETKTNANDMICSGGVNNGLLCDSTNTTTQSNTCPGGSCQQRDKLGQFLGWRGDCLEADTSRSVNGQQTNPCLTWLPVDYLNGTRDINNQFESAGFKAEEKLGYCLAVNSYKQAEETTICYDVGIPENCENTCKDDPFKKCDKIGYKLKSTFCDGNGDQGGCSTYNCNITCEPIEDSTWYSSDDVLPAEKNKTVACQAAITIGSSDVQNQEAVVWTDRLWRADQFTNIDYAQPITNLSYIYNSPAAPFGNSKYSYFNNGLLKVLACKNAGYFSMPNIKGECNKGVPTTVVGDTYDKKLTYGEWGFGSESCTQNSDCSENELRSCKKYSSGQYGTDNGTCVGGGKYDNKNCEYDSECYDWICNTQKKCQPNDGVVSANYSSQLSTAKSYIKRLFAKLPNSLFKFSTSSQVYELDTNGLGSLDVTGTNDKIDSNNYTSLNNVPVVRPVGECDDLKGNCLEVQQVGFSINNVYDKDVKIFSNNRNAIMRFYAFANKNQMPIRKVSVNWGDGTSKEYPGMFRNQRGMIRKTPNSEPVQVCTETPTHFGEILEQTCDPHYFEFTHNYFCNASMDEFDPECSEDPKNFPQGCCVFKPTVQVKDNWGWCNGKCTQIRTDLNQSVSVGGDGCYDASTKDLNNECVDYFYSTSSVNHANTLFNGNILVAPNK